MNADGLYGMYRIHNETMQAGDAAWKQHLAEEAAKGNAVGANTLDGFVSDTPEGSRTV